MAEQSPFPNLYDVMPGYRFAEAAPPAAPRGMVDPRPSGNTGVMGYLQAPIAGFYEGLGQAGGVAQAGAKLVGADGASQSAGDFAAQQRATAATYANPDIEKMAWYDPRNLGYQALKGAPKIAGMIAAGAAGGPLAAGAAMFPFLVGENVHAAEQYKGELTPGDAARAFAYGVPEAALAAWTGGKGGAILAGTKETASVGRAAASQAYTQALASGGQALIAQQMGDPNRPIAERMGEAIQSALAGGVTGAAFGAGLHAIAKKPVAKIGDKELGDAVDKHLSGEDAAPPAEPGAPAPHEDEGPSIPQHEGAEQPGLVHEPIDTTVRSLGEVDELPNFTQGEAPVLEGASAPEPRNLPPEQVIPQPGDPERLGLSNEPEPIAPRGLHELEELSTFGQNPYEGQVRFEGVPEKLRPQSRDVLVPQPEGVEQPGLVHEPEQPHVGLTPDDFDALPNFHEAPEPEAPHPLTDASREDIAAAARKAAKTLPKWFDPSSFDAARASIAKEAGPREPDSPPVRAVVAKLAETFGVDLEPKRAEPVATAKPVAEPVVTAPEPVAVAEPVPEPAPPSTAQAKVATAAAPAYERLPEIKTAVDAAQASLDALREQPVPKGQTATQWKKILDEQQDRLDAVKNGNTVDLGNIALNDTHFTAHPEAGLGKESAFDRFYDKLPENLQQALDAHEETTSGVIDALGKSKATLQGDVFSRPAGLAGAEAPRTANDVGLTGVINTTGSGKDVLDVLKTHGTPLERVVATLLSKFGIDPKIVFTPDNGRGNAATYHAADNHIELHQGAGISQPLLHELVHAASVKALQAGGRAAQAFENLFEKVKEQFPEADAKADLSYGFKDKFEFMAEAYSNSQLRDWMKSQPVVEGGVKATLWQRFKDVVANMLGVEGGKKNLLDQVLEAGGKVLEENAAAPAAPGVYASRMAPAEQVSTVRKVIEGASLAAAKLKNAVVPGVKANDLIRGLRSPDEIAASLARHAPNAVRLTEAQHFEDNLKNGWNKLAAAVNAQYHVLQAPERAKHDFVAASTVLGVDPRKPWDKQNPELARGANKDELKRVADDAYRAYNDLTPAANAALTARIDMNQTARLAASVHSLDNVIKASFPELTKGFENNPMADYLMNSAAHDDASLAKQTWLGELTKRADGMREARGADLMKLGLTADQLGALREAAALKPLKGELRAETIDARKTLKELDPKALERVDMLTRWIDHADGRIKALDDVPYFRAGRRGDFYAAGSLVADANGLADRKAVDTLTSALSAAGFGDRVIDRANNNRDLYIKVESMAQADRLRDLFNKLQQVGVLDADHKIHSGPAEQAVQHGVGPAVMQDIIAMLKGARPDAPEGLSSEATAKFDEAWDHGIHEMTRDLMDMLSNSSPLKINAKRKDVQGYAAEMGKSARDGDPGTSAMLARFGAAKDKGEAIAGLRKDMRAINESKLSTEQQKVAHDNIAELMRRETQRPMGPPNSAVTAITWISRASEIGFNPAYFVALHAQDWTYSVPELGKKHGMLNAAREIAKAELPSIKIMRAMLKDPDWEFAGMRLKTLLDSGVKRDQAEYLVALDNMGVMTHGALTQSMFSETGDSWRAKAANVSTAMGRYAELQPRIKMALAAKALWRGEAKDGPLLDFAAQRIKGSQFDYSSGNSPRQLTRLGDAGQFSPLINQFMSFRVKATEKLYREAHEMFAGETKEQRIEAGKFLAAHLAATTVISGAMGLPLVAVFASVYDKLADTLTGSPNHDIMGSFRQYLQHAYGNTAGTAIARGIPTMAGVDLSHLGDQKIAPFSDAIMMLTEKRKFEDAEKDWLKNLSGSAIGLASSWVTGARDIANGDYINGSIKFAPEALKGPVEAVRDMLYGYRTKSGTPLGITPGGIDIALTAMGLDPAELKTDSLNRETLAGLKTRQAAQSQNITQHLAKAVQTHNPEDLRYWMGQSNNYMRTWPGAAPPAARLGAYMQEQSRESAIARAGGTPLGLRPRDITARGMLAP